MYVIAYSEGLISFWQPWMENLILNGNIVAHFWKDFQWIFDQIRVKFRISPSTSGDHNSALRWNWVTSGYIRTMCSSRNVDSRTLKSPTTNLKTPNRVPKLVEFDQNLRSRGCTTLQRETQATRTIQRVATLEMSSFSAVSAPLVCLSPDALKLNQSISGNFVTPAGEAP